jgi:hypothetical protein
VTALSIQVPPGLDRLQVSRSVFENALRVLDGALQSANDRRIESAELKTVFQRDAYTCCLTREGGLVLSDRDVLQCLAQRIEE